jgi:DNA gyrase inhibitor GyrI
MRRALAIAASVAMMLAAGEPAMTQTPTLSLQVQQIQQIQPKFQPKIQPRIQSPNRPPNLPLIKPSQALIIAQRLVPNSKAVGVKLLPGGNYAVTLKSNDRALRLIIDGNSGERR